MPRKSAAALSVVPPTPVQRPPAPPELTGDQCVVWDDVVRTMPADWFDPASQPLLVAFCRHTVAARTIARLIDDHHELATTPGLKRFDKLCAMLDREHRAMGLLASKMRLCHSANRRIEAKVERKVSASARPWERRG